MRSHGCRPVRRPCGVMTQGTARRAICEQTLRNRAKHVSMHIFVHISVRVCRMSEPTFDPGREASCSRRVCQATSMWMPQICRGAEKESRAWLVIRCECGRKLPLMDASLPRCVVNAWLCGSIKHARTRVLALLLFHPIPNPLPLPSKHHHHSIAVSSLHYYVRRIFVI